MSARNQQEAERLHYRWRIVNLELRTVTTTERDAKLAFLEAAVADGWSWGRIGQALHQTATAARRYYDRNRVKV